MKMKFKAFGYHLCISVAVVMIAMGIVYGLWFKAPFAYAENVYQITLMLASVDVIMGPLLTFIVFKPNKKSLKFDLALIGLLQVAALVYGMSILHRARPVYAVYTDGLFWTVTAEDYEAEELGKVGKDNPYLRFSTWSPQYIGAIVQGKLDPDDQHKIEISQSLGGGLRLMPRFYIPYESVAVDASKSGTLASEIDFSTAPKPIPDAREASPTLEEMRRILTELKAMGPLEQLRLVQMNGSKHRAIVVLDDKTGKILGSLSYVPFW